MDALSLKTLCIIRVLELRDEEPEKITEEDLSSISSLGYDISERLENIISLSNRSAQTKTMDGKDYDFDTLMICAGKTTKKECKGKIVHLNKKGLPHGTSGNSLNKQFFLNGKLLLEETFEKDGRPRRWQNYATGDMTEWYCFPLSIHIQSSLVLYRRWNYSGALVEQRELKDGKRHGKSTIWEGGDSLKLEESEWFEGVPHGVCRSWHKWKKVMAEECVFHYGERMTYRSWNEHGTKRFSKEYIQFSHQVSWHV